MTALTRPSRFAGATVWRSVTEPITETVTPNPVTRYDAAISTPEPDRNLVRPGHLRQPHQGRRLPPPPDRKVTAMPN
jgi:hypothetical protein